MSEKSYNWDQELNEIHISFKVDTTQSKTCVEYIIKDRKIKITYNGTIILEGLLQKRVEVGSEYWVKNDDTIDFYLSKQKNEWWECLLEGTETVDVSKLAENSNIDFSMLDPEAREMIEKMAYESKMKSSTSYNEQDEKDNVVEEETQ